MSHAELCSGYGATSLALGEAPVWHAEIDRHAATVFATHWPDVPNHGDLTKIDWTTVEPVDLLTAGFPCQPISQAGLQKVVNDDRWLWPYIAQAVRVLRPRHLFLENVPPLLRPWRNKSDGLWYRAPIEEILGDLASLGYVGSWVSVRASDVGAPHLRDRVFVLAVDANHGGCEGGESQPFGNARGGHHRPDPVATTDANRGGCEEQPEPDRGTGGGGSFALAMTLSDFAWIHGGRPLPTAPSSHPPLSDGLDCLDPPPTHSLPMDD